MGRYSLTASVIDTIARDIKAGIRAEQLVYLGEIETGIDNDAGGHKALENLNKVISRAVGFLAKVFGEGKFCTLAPIAVESEENLLIVVPEDLAERSRHQSGALVFSIAKTAVVKATRPR